MIICSPSVQNVLDRLYVTAVTMGKQPVEYNRCIEVIHSVESGIIRTVAQKPLSWARAGLLVAKAGRYWFGYVMQNNVVIVDEVFDCVRNTIIDESVNKQIITLTESDLRIMIKECVRRVMEEKLNNKTVGEYTAIDGSWWDGFPEGLEGKGCVQDVRMYDRLHKDGTIDTIALFRRIENRRYFYARIVPIPGSKKTKWEPLPLKMVPSVIRNDIRTINPQGHEPYLQS